MKRTSITSVSVIALVFMLFTTSLPAQQTAVSRSEISIPFKFAKSGHQYVQIKYKGKMLNMIIDSGAGANTISNKTIKRLKLKAKKSNMKGAGIGNHQENLTELDPMTFKINGKDVVIDTLIGFEMAHLEKSLGIKPLDGLIGAPFLRANKAKLDFSNNTLTFNLDK